ncbi:anoctamin-4 isoform X2 [Tachypleus tridentatus]|uniref:anoctamin-4 isoform X2 n=1 Tax=Tachypleus tridentatus TaxID=6853 RepID=UPI003FD03217
MSSPTWLLDSPRMEQKYAFPMSTTKTSRLTGMELNDSVDPCIRQSSTDYYTSTSRGRISIVTEEMIEEIEEQRANRNTIYFRDGKRRIDFVLVYEESFEPSKDEKRKVFEENLEAEGLELELENKSRSLDGKTYFLKLHAPSDLLNRYTEIMNIKRPLNRMEQREPMAWEADDAENEEMSCSSLWCFDRENPFMYDKELIPDDSLYFSSTSNKNNDTAFHVAEEESFLTSAQRSRIVWEVLLRTPYETDSGSKTGIMRLMNNGIYLSGYPLHDGPYKGKSVRKGEPGYCERTLLYNEWARWKCWYKTQPLPLIRRYFGEKTALYFVWIGFYTTVLIPAAALGVLTMIYGISTMKTSTPSKEICDDTISGNIIMCPLCNQQCGFWRLKDSCVFSMVVHLFDNPATVGFAVFMSLWATMFMELWKRKQARTAWEWNLSSAEHSLEMIRPEYEAKVFTYKFNPVTMTFEPFLPFWEKVARITGVNSLVLLMLFSVMVAVFAVIVYRIIIVTLMFSSEILFWRKYAKIATSFTAATINLVVIVIMDRIYRKLAGKLSDIERPRTQREYEDSFTLKMFVFTFINTYSSIIYIAFFKGRFFGHPGDTITIFGYRQDQCENGGCLFEVFVQLGIIMVGKQVFNNIYEFATMKIMIWWRVYWRARENFVPQQPNTRWEEDYNLETTDSMSLFDEYLEMVIQFGFVTLFVGSFPLAPLFALLNNIVEIRLDAYKYVAQLRRPLTYRVQNIGAWQAILKGLSFVAVITNSFMIAYTSDFIPRLVYMYRYSKDGSLEGYINNTMSYFDTSDFTNTTKPDNMMLDGVYVNQCRYQDYRHPPGSDEKYTLSLQYWHIFAARLAFVVVFEWPSYKPERFYAKNRGLIPMWDTLKITSSSQVSFRYPW